MSSATEREQLVDRFSQFEPFVEDTTEEGPNTSASTATTTPVSVRSELPSQPSRIVNSPLRSSTRGRRQRERETEFSCAEERIMQFREELHQERLRNDVFLDMNKGRTYWSSYQMSVRDSAARICTVFLLHALKHKESRIPVLHSRSWWKHTGHCS